MRSLLVSLVAAAMLAAAAPAPAAEIGLNINGGPAALNDQQNFQDLSTLNAKWARHFVFWDDYDPQTGPKIYKAIAAEENARGVKTLLTVMSARGTAPDPEAFERFMRELATELKGDVEAYEVWNEADEGLFWSGGPNPTAYVDVLKRSYAAVKGADPNALVVFSPTVGNNFGFVQEAYAAGAKGSFDVMAVHTDTACLVQPPSFFYRENDGRLGRFTFLGYREVYGVMQANGDGDKPIWMTEFGWSAAQHTCEFGAGAGQRPAGVSEELQAQYLLDAMNCVERDPYLQVAFWYNNRDLSNDGKMANMYGLRRYKDAAGGGGDPRPAFEAFRTWGAGGGRSSAPCGDFEGPPVKLLAPSPGLNLGAGQNLIMRAQSDAPDLKRIYFTVEGPGAAPLFEGGPISLPRPGDTGPIGEREWGGARDLGDGTHKLTVYAVDQLDNAGPPVTLTFTKGTAGGPTGPGAGGVRFPKLKLAGKGRRRTYTGGALPGITKGAVRIEWHHKQGRRWKRLHSRAVQARSPFKVTQRLRRAGSWRVRAVYLGPPRVASCWTLFNTKSAKTRLSCPKGAVRPGR